MKTGGAVNYVLGAPAVNSDAPMRQLEGIT